MKRRERREEKEYSQRTTGQNYTDSYFFPRDYLQSHDGWNRKHQNKDIGKDVEQGGRFHRSIDVVASSFYKHIPKFLARMTDKYVETGDYQIKCEKNADSSVN